jgi:hypothetical protein
MGKISHTMAYNSHHMAHNSHLQSAIDALQSLLQTDALRVEFFGEIEQEQMVDVRVNLLVGGGH